MPNPDTKFSNYHLILVILQFTSGIKIHDWEIKQTKNIKFRINQPGYFSN